MDEKKKFENGAAGLLDEMADWHGRDLSALLATAGEIDAAAVAAKAGCAPEDVAELARFAPGSARELARSSVLGGKGLGLAMAMALRSDASPKSLRELWEAAAGKHLQTLPALYKTGVLGLRKAEAMLARATAACPEMADALAKYPPQPGPSLGPVWRSLRSSGSPFGAAVFAKRIGCPHLSDKEALDSLIDSSPDKFRDAARRAMERQDLPERFVSGEAPKIVELLAANFSGLVNARGSSGKKKIGEAALDYFKLTGELAERSTGAANVRRVGFAALAAALGKGPAPSWLDAAWAAQAVELLAGGRDPTLLVSDLPRRGESSIRRAMEYATGCEWERKLAPAAELLMKAIAGAVPASEPKPSAPKPLGLFAQLAGMNGENIGCPEPKVQTKKKAAPVDQPKAERRPVGRPRGRAAWTKEPMETASKGSSNPELQARWDAFLVDVWFDKKDASCQWVKDCFMRQNGAGLIEFAGLARTPKPHEMKFPIAGWMAGSMRKISDLLFDAKDKSQETRGKIAASMGGVAAAPYAYGSADKEWLNAKDEALKLKAMSTLTRAAAKEWNAKLSRSNWSACK